MPTSKSGKNPTCKPGKSYECTRPDGSKYCIPQNKKCRLGVGSALPKEQIDKVADLAKKAAGGRKKSLKKMSIQELFQEADRIGSKYQDKKSSKSVEIGKEGSKSSSVKPDLDKPETVKSALDLNLYPINTANSRIKMVRDDLNRISELSGPQKEERAQEILRDLDFDMYPNHLLSTNSDKNATNDVKVEVGARLMEPTKFKGMSGEIVSVPAADARKFRDQAFDDARKVWSLADNKTKNEWAKQYGRSRDGRSSLKDAFLEEMHDDLVSRREAMEAEEEESRRKSRAEKRKASKEELGDLDDLFT